MNEDHVVAAFFGLGFLFASITTLRLFLKYRRVATELAPEPNILGGGAVLIAFIITLACGYFGGVSTRRLLGGEPLDWTPFTGTIVAGLVLFGIPAILNIGFEMIERQVIRVERVEYDARVSAEAARELEEQE